MKILRISLILSLFLACSAALHAKGAGICPIFDDGTVLLGKEMRIHKHGPQKGQKYVVWGDCGGQQDPNETLAKTAWREFLEETAHYTFGVGSPYNIHLNHVLQAEANGHFADHDHPATGQFYRTYFVKIPGQKPDLQTFHRNAARAKRKLGHKAHVEKTDWIYVDAHVLKNAAFQNGNLPGTNEPLFDPFKAVIRKPSAQNFLQNVVPLPIPNPPAPTPQRKQKQTKKKVIRKHIKKKTTQKRPTRSQIKKRVSKRKMTRPPIKKKVTTRRIHRKKTR